MFLSLACYVRPQTWVESQVGKFAFVANSRARTVDDTEGLVKFISDKKTDKILGAHIMGPNAGMYVQPCSLCAQLLWSLPYQLHDICGACRCIQGS